MTRMEKTRSWIVAIKGLMLMHGVLCCKTPAVWRIWRLPFDISNLEDGHMSATRNWGYNVFIRSYLDFLEQRSAVLHELGEQTQGSIALEVIKLQNLQSLLDLLIGIKPFANNSKVRLILEAMDCVVIEIFDIYSRICNGIARVLMRIHSASKLEASMAPTVLQKTKSQAEDLTAYLEFCRDFGVSNSTGLPKLPKIPNGGIQELRRITGGVTVPDNHGSITDNLIDINNRTSNTKAMVVKDHNALLLVEKEEPTTKNGLKTIIPNNWESFNEGRKEVNDESNQGVFTSTRTRNPFETPSKYYHLPLAPVDNCYNKQEIPDLMSF